MQQSLGATGGSLPVHLTSDLSLVSRRSCTHDALVFLLLLCNLPSVQAIPQSGVADVHEIGKSMPKVRVRLMTYTPENTVYGK